MKNNTCIFKIYVIYIYNLCSTFLGKVNINDKNITNNYHLLPIDPAIFKIVVDTVHCFAWACKGFTR